MGTKGCLGSSLFTPCVSSMLIVSLLECSRSGPSVGLCCSRWHLLHTGLVHYTSSKTLALHWAVSYPSPAVTLWLLFYLSVLTQLFGIVPYYCLCHIWHPLVTDLDSMLVEQLGQGVIRGEGSVQ